VLMFAAFSTIAVSLFRGWREARRSAWTWFLAAAAGGSVAFAALPSVLFAPRFHVSPGFYLPHLVLVLTATAVFLVTVHALPASVFRRRMLVAFPVLAVAAAFAFAPSWRSAAAQLVSAPGYATRAVATEIARIVPEDAVVVGERARLVLMGHPHRTATTMPSCTPIPIVDKLFAADPSAKVYALLDSQNAYNLKHFRENAARYGLEHLKTFKMPSFGDGKPCDVYLCRVVRRSSADGEKK